MILGTSVVVVQLGSLPGGVTSRRTASTSVSEDGRRRDTVDQLELLFYETQLELYDTKFEVLKNEEQLLVAQIDSVRRQIKGGPHTLSDEWGCSNISASAKLVGYVLVHPKTLPVTLGMLLMSHKGRLSNFCLPENNESL